MIHEVRTIKFGKTELEQALNAYRHLKADLLPPGRITGFAPSTNKELTVGVETSHGSFTSHVHVALPAHHVTDALIKFCIANNVVLPAKADKEVLYADGDAMLMMQLAVNVG